MLDQGDDLLEGFGNKNRTADSDDDDEESDTDSSQSITLEQLHNEESEKDLPCVRSKSPMVPRPAQNKASKQRFGAALNIMGGKGIIIPRKPSFHNQDIKSEEELYEEKLGLNVPAKRTGEFRFTGMSRSSNHSVNTRKSKLTNSFNSIASEDLGSSNQDSAASLSVDDEDEGDFLVDFPTNREEILDSRHREDEKDVGGESDMEKIEKPLKVEEEIDQRKPWRRMSGLSGVGSYVGGCEMSVEQHPNGANIPLGGSNHIISSGSSILGGSSVLRGSGNTATLNGSANKIDGSTPEIIVNDVDGYDNLGFYFEDEKKKVDECDTSSDITDYSTRSSVISELQHAKAALGWKDDEASLGGSQHSLSCSVRSLTKYGDSSSRSLDKNSIDKPDLSREKERRAERRKSLPTIPDEGYDSSASASDPRAHRRGSSGTLDELRQERDGLKVKPRTFQDSTELSSPSFEEKSPIRSKSGVPRPPKNRLGVDNAPDSSQNEDSNANNRASNKIDPPRNDLLDSFTSGVYIDEQEVGTGSSKRNTSPMNTQDGYASNETTPSRDYELRKPASDDRSVSSEASSFLRPKKPNLEDSKHGGQPWMRRSSKSLGDAPDESEVAGESQDKEITTEEEYSPEHCVRTKSSEDKSKRSGMSKSSSSRKHRNGKSKRHKKKKRRSRQQNGVDIPIPGDDLSARTPEDSKEEERMLTEFTSGYCGSVASNALSTNTGHSISKSMDSISEGEDIVEKARAPFKDASKERGGKTNRQEKRDDAGGKGEQGSRIDIESGIIQSDGDDSIKEPREERPREVRGRRLSLVTSGLTGATPGPGFHGIWDDDEAMAKKGKKKSSIIGDNLKTTLRTKSWGLKMQRIFGTRCWNWKITIIGGIVALLVLLCVVIPLSASSGDDTRGGVPQSSTPPTLSPIPKPTTLSPTVYPGPHYEEIDYIEGRAGNETGQSVSISSDGRYLAVGSPNDSPNSVGGTGKVEVFELNNGEYVPFGNPILSDEQNDRFGFSVSLSDSGEDVVIGAPSADNSAGYAVVYKFDPATSTWIQIGNNRIEPAAQSGGTGWAVAISGDGKRVAVGTPLANGRDGIARMYEYKAALDLWAVLGQVVKGEFESKQLMGYSVSMDETGETVAIGAVHSPFDGQGRRGRVYMMRLFSKIEWQQVGDPLDGADLFGRSVSLSADGETVAVGSTGYDNGREKNAGACGVYTYLNKWKQLGTTLAGEVTDERSGYSVALSRDGKRLACGGQGGSVVRVHEYNSSADNKWEQIGDTIQGGNSFGTSLAIDNSGAIMAVGAPNGSGGNVEGVNAGLVRIYKYR